ncbi:DUF4376 domain-containing protein [Collimonas humicola]|uniref:DUF4376 domain-containing protein n=1 Tax=Collimonas humicola TaxID=2825886 RepID=UPI001B8B6029|nr:DUF4376 domain-containing protein [Collimonas humicola]
MYKLSFSGVIRLSDDTLIPACADNIDYQNYLIWVAAGNTPEPIYSLAELQAQNWANIKNLRSVKQNGGVVVGKSWFQTDANSRIQYLALVMMGANLPADIQWKLYDNSFVTMTQQLAAQVFTALATSDQAIFAHAEQLKASMMALSDPSNFDATQGWPKIYGE